MVKEGYDFGGWLTKYGIECSDGKTLMDDSFKDQDGKRVSLVFDHQHGMHDIIGHADLEHRPGEGVYCWGKFNDEPEGKHAKALVKNGDLVALSVFANRLKKNPRNLNQITHGNIIEASLVMAGANPGAYIDEVAMHSDNPDEVDAAYISFVEYQSANVEMAHSDSENNTNEKEKAKMPEENKKPEEGKSVEEIVDTMSDEQKQALYILVEASYQQGKAEKDASEEVKHSDTSEENTEATTENNETQNNNNEEENNNMQHNIFEGARPEADEDVIKHAEGLDVILKGAKSAGSLKESYLAHKDSYGIDHIDYLFPEAKSVTNTPIVIDRPQGWVQKVMQAVHHVPFSNIKSLYADITEDDARAKGYFKGNLKKEEVFSLLKRKTGPTTVYKKQKMDKQDIDSITDFNVVTWIKAEMRGKLDEELARAFLFGDLRLASSDDKIDENCIRPLCKAEELFALTATITGADASEKADKAIDASIEVQEEYQGSGHVVSYIRTSYVTKMLLLRDKQGHRMYKSLTELATAMGVDEIVKIPGSVMPEKLIAINVDLADYYVGADKGAKVDMFEDFDIDYNQEKYLIETRCSGTPVLPKSVMIIKEQ